ncbi:hypothetical protein SPRG_20659, partial [Saprolegnia parasitica CBS 223.65]
KKRIVFKCICTLLGRGARDNLGRRDSAAVLGLVHDPVHGRRERKGREDVVARVVGRAEARAAVVPDNGLAHLFDVGGHDKPVVGVGLQRLGRRRHPLKLDALGDCFDLEFVGLGVRIARGQSVDCRANVERDPRRLGVNVFGRHRHVGIVDELVDAARARRPELHCDRLVFRDGRAHGRLSSGRPLSRSNCAEALAATARREARVHCIARV